MVIAASSIFETLSDVGIRQSIIHSTKGIDADYLNVAWWVQSLRGLGLYLFGIIVAPWVGQFYDMPELVLLLRVAFLTMFFYGLRSPRAWVLEKQMRFGRYIILIQGSGLLSTLVTIGLAIYLRNVWALVIGVVSQAVILCILSFVLCPFLPRLTIDKDSLRELLDFAKGMFGLSFMAVIILQIPVFVLGKMVSDVQLGMYYLAFQLAYQPVQLFNRVVGKILLPAFAEKQHEKKSICRVMLTMARSTSIFIVPLLALTIICAGLILSLVYGSQYAAVATPFILLCVWGLVLMESIKVSSIFLGMGLPRLYRRIVALRGLLLAGLIYPATFYWGLSGAAAAMLAAYSIGLVLPFIWMKKLIGFEILEYGRAWLPGLLLSVFVFVPMALLRFINVEYIVLNVITAGLGCLTAVVVGVFYLRRRYKLI
jgi:O-antigen/teichoic acid export membrane protein